MTTIGLVADDQSLEVAVNPVITSGEENTVILHVDFSEDWNGFGKTAVFFTEKNKNTLYEKIMSGGECIVPSEVMVNEGTFLVGIRGVNSTSKQVKTTSLVKYKISRGTPAVEEFGPTPDVYEQLLSAYETVDSSIDKLNSDIEFERARIDNLSTLKEGGTTADAELIDIRVKVDGSTATSAGNAVREQINALKGDLGELKAFKNITYSTYDGVNEITNVSYSNDKYSGYYPGGSRGFFINLSANKKYVIELEFLPQLINDSSSVMWVIAKNDWSGYLDVSASETITKNVLAKHIFKVAPTENYRYGFGAQVTFNQINDSLMSIKVYDVTEMSSESFNKFTFDDIDVLYNTVKYALNAKKESNWNGKTWVALGDSKTEGAWTEQYGRYTDKVSEYLGLNCINLGVGGSTVNKFAEQNEKQLTSEIAQSADLITIYGSINNLLLEQEVGYITDEASSTGSIMAQWKYTINKCMSLNPNCQYLVICDHWSNPDAITDNTKIKECMYKIEEMVHEYYHLPVLNLFKVSGINQYNATHYLVNATNVHENSNGVLNDSNIIIHKLLELEPLIN